MRRPLHLVPSFACIMQPTRAATNAVHAAVADQPANRLKLQPHANRASDRIAEASTMRIVTSWRLNALTGIIKP